MVWFATNDENLRDGCESVSHINEINGRIVLFKRGEWYMMLIPFFLSYVFIYSSFATKVQHAMNAGAVGTVIMDNDAEANFVIQMDLSELNTVPIYVWIVGYDDGNYLRDTVKNNPNAVITMYADYYSQSYPNQNDNMNPNVLSGFSSRGPMGDGRLAPVRRRLLLAFLFSSHGFCCVDGCFSW